MALITGQASPEAGALANFGHITELHLAPQSPQREMAHFIRGRSQAKPFVRGEPNAIAGLGV